MKYVKKQNSPAKGARHKTPVHFREAVRNDLRAFGAIVGKVALLVLYGIGALLADLAILALSIVRAPFVPQGKEIREAFLENRAPRTLLQKLLGLKKNAPRPDYPTATQALALNKAKKKR